MNYLCLDIFIPYQELSIFASTIFNIYFGRNNIILNLEKTNYKRYFINIHLLLLLLLLLKPLAKFIITVIRLCVHRTKKWSSRAVRCINFEESHNLLTIK